MYAYRSLLTHNEWKLQPDAAEEKSEASGAEIREKVADVIAEGMVILTAVRRAPKRLIREGERLAEAARNAPGDEPPRNLWQAVRNWTENVIEAIKGKGSRRPQTPGIEQRLTRLEQRVDALTAEMRAGFERVRGEFERVHEESERVRGEFGRVHEEFGRVHEESERVRGEFGRVYEEFGRVYEEFERVHGRIDELQRDQRAAMRETRAHFRGLRGLTYGPLLERWVMRSLPTYLLSRCSALLRAGPLQTRVLHHDQADWHLSQAFQDQWQEGAYPLSDQENPLLSDLVLSLRLKDESQTLLFVCEVSTAVDQGDLERVMRRSAWLRGHHGIHGRVSVIPLLIGIEWIDSLEADALHVQTLCAQPVIRHKTDADGVPYPDGIDRWHPVRGFEACVQHWMDVSLKS